MEKRKFLKNRYRGLTLIELLVVIAILGMLSSLVAVNVVRHLKKAKITQAKAQIKMLHEAVKQYKLDTGEYPSSSDGLNALVVEPPGVNGWDKEGYLDGAREIPLDPWGKEYYYEYPGEYSTFDIYTLGRDGQPGGEEEDADIYNSSTGRTPDQEDLRSNSPQKNLKK
jgi:general secretion pathway protein G